MELKLSTPTVIALLIGVALFVKWRLTRAFIGAPVPGGKTPHSNPARQTA